jgi:hypothetical protein
MHSNRQGQRDKERWERDRKREGEKEDNQERRIVAKRGKQRRWREGRKRRWSKKRRRKRGQRPDPNKAERSGRKKREEREGSNEDKVEWHL